MTTIIFSATFKSFKALCRVAVALGALAFLTSAFPALAQSGQFTYVIGSVTIERGTERITPVRGTAVNPLDVIQTGADGMAQLAMVDQAKLSLRSNSRLLVQQYPVTASDPPGAVLNLVRGTLRTFTALLTPTNRAGYRFHQDLRFRERKDAYRDLMTSYINTGLAIDPATTENGCLRIFPDSHKLGYLGLSDDGTIMKGTTQETELRNAGLDPARVVNIELEPGDLALWGLLTVHGSNANNSSRDRAFAIQSYVRAANSERGEWAFRDGVSTPLGDQPVLCKYEQLHEKPGPFYSDDRWYE